MKKLIGYGTTDEHGIATIDKKPDDTDFDPHGYTGSGVGQLQIRAELHDDSSIQSDTYELWDTLFYDDGVTDPKIVTWYNYGDRLTVSVDENGTTLLRDASSGSGYFFTSQTGNLYSAPLVIEFDVVSYSNYNSCGLDFSTNNFANDNNKTMNNLSISQGDSVKIVYDGTTIKVYRNGSTTPTEVPLSTSGNFTIGFFIGAGHSLKYKNFKLYNG